jgi:deferrochelatase/peroxidase EfeB
VTPRLSRRELLRAGAATGGALALAACTDASPLAGRAEGPAGPRFVPFAGPHQTGITTSPAPARGLMAAFTVVAGDRAELAATLRDLTDEIRGLMSGRPPEQRDPRLPPVDSGLLGAEPQPDDLSVIVSVGASLFDDRYGLADRRPVQLVQMPFLANDRLDPGRSHGDLLLTLESGHSDTAIFALRQLLRRTRGTLVLRWTLDGYTRGVGTGDGGATPRNLMGFKDGTANLDPSCAGVQDRYVWVADGDGEPAWATGGSYHVVRVIRMLVEFWDRTPLAEQEALIGRHKLSGAPLGARAESDVPDYAADPEGDVIPLDAHIRLANPRTPETEDSLLLRRGFSYARGFDRAGRLDQGLAFVCYQRDLGRGFLAVQSRLAGEPLEEYTLPEGGGFYFALPGVPGDEGFLGDRLVSA